MSSTDLHKELFRKKIINGSGIIGALCATEELKRANFFIDTMERFIMSSETVEVQQLELQALALSEEEKNEFWQWNYPVHWQDIFGVRIRSAFCAQLCSQVEATLGDIAHRVQIIERCRVKVKDIKGSTLEQHKLYLTAFARFNGPSAEIWKETSFLFKIRNAHVHQQGYVGELIHDTAFSHFLSSISGIDTQNNFIELKAGSCTALLEITERFHKALLKEYDEYRLRAAAKDHFTSEIQT